MTLHRTFAAGTAAATVVLALAAVPVGPAHAHGATTDPVSRAVACGPDGGAGRGSAACRAAVAAGGGADLPAFDNLRVADVAGRDRARIPDGKLCSAGLPEYRGLDLPRADWPSTRLTAGAAYTFSYRATIPHRGTFRLYLSAEGYDPERALRWSDLEREPFLTVVDPQLRGGSYRFSGRLPAGRTGRQLIYAIWQNSDTPDTYYSCSDVVLGVPATLRRPPARTDPQRNGAPPQRPQPGGGQPSVAEPVRGRTAAGAAGGTGADAAVRPLADGPVPAGEPNGAATTVPAGDGHGPLVVAGLAAVLAVATGWAALRRSRRNRERS